MNRISIVRSLYLVIALTLAACGNDSDSNVTAPLSDKNLNLIFVISPDLAFHATGDIHPSTGNLTSQGLQRSLLTATFLKQEVLGTKNVTGIYALQPMTHLQTASQYPDMAALMTLQQFALLNQITLPDADSALVTGNSYPINASYTPGSIPIGVAPPLPELPCPGCQGIEFSDTVGNNEALISGIIKASVPGFHVFSAPWETTSALLVNINRLYGDSLDIPLSYPGPDHIYTVSITPSGNASLVTYNSHLNPPSTYPTLSSSALVSTPCTAQTPFSIVTTGGSDGAVIPAGANTNATIHMIRHAEAHPSKGWEDGNFVAAGQWRALNLPNALNGKISPNLVYSIDPAQIIPGQWNPATDGPAPGFMWSYVRPSLTVAPYVIANNLPFYLFADLAIVDPHSPPLISRFFFTGGQFSNQTVLLAWEHDTLTEVVRALVASYFPAGGGPTVPAWPDADYDTIWTAKLDARGHLTLDNGMCQGLNSATLPTTAPPF